MLKGRSLLPAHGSRLSAIDIFSGLSPTELAQMDRQACSFTCEPGRLLYTPCDRSHSLFLLGRGHVQLYRLSRQGRKLVVADLAAGDFFGAMPPDARETYQTFAKAIDLCVLYRIDRADAERMLLENPGVAIRVVAALGQRLQHLERRLEAMAFQDVSARLAGLLLRLADDQGSDLVLGYTHQDLAEMLGTYRETVSDTMHTFRVDGLVQSGRREVGLKDRARLKEVAAS